MSEPRSIKSIIALWPSRAELASDICARGFGIGVHRVNKWAQRGTIPPEFHWPLVLAAQTRGIDLTAADIARAHSGNSTEVAA